MKEEKVKSGYNRLKRDVIAICNPSIDEDFDPSKILRERRKNIIGRIENISGIPKPFTERTLRNYFQADTFTDTIKYIGLLAAVWLENAKVITKEQCRKFYLENNITSTHYWEEFLKYIDNEPKFEEPGALDPKEMWKSEIADIPKVYPLFDGPEYPFNLERPASLDKLYLQINQERLIVIDGIPGTGKMHFVKSLESKLQRSGKYKHFLWRLPENGYSLSNLLDEIEAVFPLAGNSIAERSASLISQLKANQAILIFCEIERFDEESFKDFFSKHALSGGNCHFILIRNNLSKFHFLGKKNIFNLHGFSLEEITQFCSHKGWKVDDEQVIQLILLSEGLPFYLEHIIEANIERRNRENSSSQSSLRSRDMENWIEKWTISLDKDSQSLLHLLSALGMPFNHEEVERLGKLTGLTIPKISFQKLADAHLAIPANNSPHQWKIRTLVAQYYNSRFNPGLNARMHELVATYLVPVPEQIILKPDNEDDLPKLITAAQHYQQAGIFQASKLILNYITPQLKKINKYPVIYDLFQTELNNNPSSDPWASFNFAHACFVLGKFQECFFTLRKCISRAQKWYHNHRQDPRQVSYFLKIMQLFSELCGMAGLHNEAVKILESTLAIFDYSELSWDHRAHAIKVLSGFYCKIGEPETCIQINESLRKDDYEGTDQARAIVFTHQGIATYEMGLYGIAEEYLRKATIKFSEYRDLRGISWSEFYMALTLIAQEKNLEAEPYIRSVLNYYHKGQVYTPEYRVWLAKVEALGLESGDLLKTEILRTEAISRKNGITINSREFQSQVEKVLKDLVRMTLKPFDLESFIHPLSENDIPYDAELFKTLVNKIRQEPGDVFDKISVKNPDAIFKDDLINTLIVEGTRMFGQKEFILREIINPNFDYIFNLPKEFDKVKIIYARVFHLNKKHDKAIELLSAVNRQNQKFEFLNLMGNCYREKRNFEKCDEYYDFAEPFAESNREKAMLYHNKAMRIVEDPQPGQYPKAIQYCKDAIPLSVDQYKLNRCSVNTLVVLEILVGEVNKVVAKVRELQSEHDISNARLENILQIVRDRQKANRIAKEIMGSYPGKRHTVPKNN